MKGASSEDARYLGRQGSAMAANTTWPKARPRDAEQVAVSTGLASWFFNARDLIGAHRSLTTDRDILACNKPLFAQAKADFVVLNTFCVVEVPLTAGFSPQATDLDCAILIEASDPTQGLMQFPFNRIQVPFTVQRHKEIISFLAGSRWMCFLAGQEQADVSELRAQILFFGH